MTFWVGIAMVLVVSLGFAIWLPTRSKSSAKPTPQVTNHAAAQRLARTLVSDIKVTYPDKLAEGRRHKAVHRYLRGPINQANRAYYGMVAKAITQERDYLHEEMVDRLAEGNQTLLGWEYAAARNKLERLQKSK